MELLWKLWEIAGVAGTAWAVLSAILIACWTIRGFLPVFYRLGHGLWRRKIAIVATGDALGNLDGLIRDSKLFNSANIIRAAGEGELESLTRASIILVHWPDCAEFIDQILALKKEQTALIIYAPHRGGPVPNETMQTLETRKHVIVNNFRGRLMNDIVSSMITTGYETGAD